MTFETHRYKVVTYISVGEFEPFATRLRSEFVNRLGEYENCVSWSEVTSVWTPLEGARPFIGEAGKESREREMRIEMLCNEEDVASLVRRIKAIHPYEEVGIDIFPVLSAEDFLRGE